jgi:hypothetical protein
MYNFDQSFIAKIQGIWRPVHGQFVVVKGYKYLLCKYNGYAYHLNQGFERKDSSLSDEELTKIAISYNTTEMNFQIQVEREDKRINEQQRMRTARAAAQFT